MRMRLSTMRLLQLICLFLLLLLVNPAVNTRLLFKSFNPHIEEKAFHIDGKYFKDLSGRTCLFHGFNAVNKGFPWYPKDLLNDTKLQYYKQWGFNVVRLGTMWTGAQPNQGAFNSSYLEIMEDIIKKLKAYDIYVILDMHQDVLSSFLGSYDGVPRWLLEKIPPPTHKYPWPFSKISQWAEGYLTEATGQAFQAIYDNLNGTQDDMSLFWKKVAVKLGILPNVIGYELINEPWAGDIFHDPALLAPGEAGRTNLEPLYHKLSSSIRSVDPDAVIFYEPVTWGIYFKGKVTGTGFTSVPGGSAFQNHSVLSYHYYCWAFRFDQHDSHYNIFARTVCDKAFGPDVFHTIQNDVTRLGGSSFLTEFGLCNPDGKSNSSDTIECNFVMDQADKNFQSWTYWDSQFFNSTGDVNLNTVKSFVRAYPRAIAGIPIEFYYDSLNKSFLLSYTPSPTITAPTVIFIPLIHYPQGFNVNASDGLSWSYDNTLQELYINVKKHTLSSSNSYYVKITAK